VIIRYKSRANKEAIKIYNKEHFLKKSHKRKYHNNRVEVMYRFIKWYIQSMLDFKSFDSTLKTLAAIEIARVMMKK
jgi:transposase-like protein